MQKFCSKNRRSRWAQKISFYAIAIQWIGPAVNNNLEVYMRNEFQKEKKLSSYLQRILRIFLILLFAFPFFGNCLKADVNDKGPSQLLAIFLLAQQKYKLGGSFTNTTGGTSGTVVISEPRAGSVTIGSPLPVSSGGSIDFTLPGALKNFSKYGVSATVSGATCSVTGPITVINGTGTVSGSEVTDIKVSCP